ncbi:MAG: peptidase M23 [Chloroflexota bacterium]
MTAPVKAYLKTEDGKTITFLFNPAQLSYNRTVSWGEQKSPLENAPQLTFDRGQSATISFDLQMDTTDTGDDVSVHTNALMGLMKVNTTKKRPVWVQLGWGRLSSFKAVVTSVNVSFTYFGSDGTPLRARANVSLRQFQDEANYPLQNPTSGTRRQERLHIVKPGETLDRIAYQAYGDSTGWRLIAERNRIQDPMRLPAGMQLLLPEREAASRGR